MKKLLLVSVFLFVSFTYAQKEDVKDILTCRLVDEVPVFPGCENSENKNKCLQYKMRKHSAKHFNSDLGNCLKEERYFDKKEKIEKTKCLDSLNPGKYRIYAMFVIGKKGIVEDIKVRAPHPVLKKEGERIVKLLPEMKPGKAGGTPVKIKYTLPITLIVD